MRVSLNRVKQGIRMSGMEVRGINHCIKTFQDVWRSRCEGCLACWTIPIGYKCLGGTWNGLASQTSVRATVSWGGARR